MTVSQPLLDPRVEGRQIIRTDPHCHILPGLDDGSPDLDMSLRMARRMVSLGIENVVATPHGVHPAIETNVHPDFLRKQVAKLKAVFDKEGIPLNVFPGTEIYLRRRVIEEFEKGGLLTWADQGRFVLVELGFQGHSKSLMDVIDYFLDRDIVPIIAHPERYAWLPNEVEIFTGLRERGCVFQFNTMSINGHFGPRVRELVMRLLPYSGAYIIGTDSHNDADKYFDFKAVGQALQSIGLLRDDGMAIPGELEDEPVLSTLPE